MTKRAKIIIGAVIVALLALAGYAGWATSGGISPSKTSNQIKADVEKAFEGKDYFKEVKVKSYSGANEVEDPEAELNTGKDSAGIQISFNDMSADNFKEAASLLPELKMTAFYSIGSTSDIANVTTVTGFLYEDLKDAEKVEAIASSLKVRETYEGEFWQISGNNAEGTDENKMKTQFVTKSTSVSEIRKTVDAVLSPKMDVLPVTKTELSSGSFAQFAAVHDKMTNYDKGLEIGLKFADAAFIDGKDVVFLGLGDDIQVSYSELREGLDKAKLEEIVKELNTDQLFKISVVSPEDAAAQTETPAEEEPTVTETATPSPSAEEGK